MQPAEQSAYTQFNCAQLKCNHLNGSEYLCRQQPVSNRGLPEVECVAWNPEAPVDSQHWPKSIFDILGSGLVVHVLSPRAEQVNRGRAVGSVFTCANLPVV